MTDVDRLVVLSPHLDDGVLSCGQLVLAAPEAVMVTVFAGVPPRGMTTDYDTGCGFATSPQAVRARRDEDRCACDTLGTRPVHLDLLDCQYRDGPVSDLAARVQRFIRDGSDVVAPLGLCHPDHVAVSDSALDGGDYNLWLYEDLPYRVYRPDAVVDRMAELGERGVKLEADKLPVGDLTVKQQAARCYVSQTHGLGDLGNEHCWLVPERYWRVIR